MILMNKNKEVLQFDVEEFYARIISNDHLPYCLKDYLRNSDDIRTAPDLAKNNDLIRTFFADRTLSLSRDNAKAILNAAHSTQNLSTESRCQLSLDCRAVSVMDSYWVKKEGEALCFEDVNIRKRHLGSVMFPVSMRGEPASIQKSLWEPDISTTGMFRKTWVQEPDGLYLLKSDKTTGFINTHAEVDTSDYLDCLNVNHVKYTLEYREGLTCAKCACMVDDDTSFVTADHVRQWCAHTGTTLEALISSEAGLSCSFGKMVAVDYLFGNTDRHTDNWGFFVNSNTNQIIEMAPLFDHNQALLVFELAPDTLDNLIYDPTNLSFTESVKRWLPTADLRLCSPGLPEFFQKRLCRMEKEFGNRVSTHHYRPPEPELR